MTQHKIYLAGPEVFLDNVADLSARKKDICARYGLAGVFPLDAEINQHKAMTPQEHARAISEANEGLMRDCDGLIANCTPFRGPSMDIGTGYEIGFMRARGRPVFGYSNVVGDYKQRAERYHRAHREDAVDPYTAGADIEDFGLFENLMIAVALRNHDFDVVCRSVEPGSELTDLAAFETCAEMAAEHFARQAS